MSETLSFDVVIVGAGPAGLSAAIRLKQIAPSLSVCVLEKGSEVGAHILSGNVFNPQTLTELFPDWQDRGAPLTVPVTQESFALLTSTARIPLPTPPQMKNHGHYIISLATLTRWLAQQAEGLGVEIYAGFSVARCLYDAQDRVMGVETTPMGVGRDGQPTPHFQEGVRLEASYVMLAEGCRGSLTKEVEARFDLRAGKQPQTYALGVKEIWQIDPAKHHQGLVQHTIGWPLTQDTYGGSFLYHMDHHQVAYGFVVGLDYQNPYLSPYLEAQRFKHHPHIQSIFEGGKRLAYGARALNEGGYQSIPHLTFPGGCLIGCAAGFMNVPAIKGSHTAMKSGMLAAECAAKALLEKKDPPLGLYDQLLDESWVGRELYAVRNIRPAFRKGLWAGLAYAALDTYLLRGRAPWTFKHAHDHASLRPAKDCAAITYPPCDGKISFDRLTNVFYSGTSHEEDQPCHLKLTDPDLAISKNWQYFASPETRYCPAGVYEIVKDPETGTPHLEIHAQNCVHCKTCDIKDPCQNITWVPPEGGGGPKYPNM